MREVTFWGQTARWVWPRQLAGDASAAETCAAGAWPKRDSELAGCQTRAASAEAKGQMMESLSDLEFSFAIEVAYHDARQAFFEGAHRWAMFLTIMLGTTAITKFGSERSLALFAALVAAADIAFDFMGRAQRHADLRRRYYEVLAEMAKSEDGNDVRFQALYMVISADEPPLYLWASKIARRNTCINMEREIPDPLPLWQRALAHVWRG